jgi:hypothetical protein
MVRAITIRDAFGEGTPGDLLAETDRLLSLFLEGAGR